MALIYAMLLGADSIDDCALLRAGRTRRLLGGWLPAPSTLGTFLRAFTFGHVRQLDRLLAESLTRAWAAGAGPGYERLVIDVDSFVGEVHGYKKQGVGFGYTKQRGYHPMLASRADTGEVLHVRLRKGQAASPRGVLRFADELIARVERAGASGVKLLRADSAFWNKKLIARLQAAGWQYSISVRLQFWVKDAVSLIPESDWITLEDYPEDGRGADRADDRRPATTRRAPHPTRRRTRPSCGPTGATSRSSPTAPKRSSWSRPSTASTPSSSSRSAISKTKPSRTSPPASSTPTAPGP